MDFFAGALIRWRWLVIVAWGIVAVVSAIRAPRTPALLDVRGGSLRETEAMRAERLVRERFERPVSDFAAVTVEGPGTFADSTGAPRAVLRALTQALDSLPFTTTVVSLATLQDSAFMVGDPRTTFIIAGIDKAGARNLADHIPVMRATIRDVLGRVPDGAAYRALVTGRTALDVDVRGVSVEDTRQSERDVFPLTFAILLLAFGALVASVLPLVVGFLAVTVSIALVGVLARVTPMNVFVLQMATMIGLGVGIDYSLLVVTRFREEMNRGLGRLEAATATVRTAGSAVLTSGLTVVVGFGALLFTPLIETRSVGIGGLVVVAAAVLLSVTLLPAMLAVLGRNIDRPKWLAKRLAWYHAPAIWEQWARTLSRHPLRALAIGTTIIGVLTAPVFLIKVGLPARNWWPNQVEAGKALELMEQNGVSNYMLPIRIVVELPDGRTPAEATVLRGLRNLSDSLRTDPRVREVRSLVDLTPRRSLLELTSFYGDLDSARATAGAFIDGYLSRDDGTTVLDVILRDTVSLTTSMQFARDVRTRLEAPPRQLRGATFLVGGFTASAVDFQDDLLRRFPLIVALVLGATAVMLAIAFRSVLIPLKAIALNALSVSATFGLVVLVFQHGVGGRLVGLDGPTSAIFVVVPVLVFAIVFGLSMDYEVFLLSRIKEAFDRTGNNRLATMEGVSATASVITSAALIMILVFGAFAFGRVLLVQFLGFGLAVAVFLDATVIRMVLVPAFMQIAGRWNWWPGVRAPRD